MNIILRGHPSRHFKNSFQPPSHLATTLANKSALLLPEFTENINFIDCNVLTTQLNSFPHK